MDTPGRHEMLGKLNPDMLMCPCVSVYIEYGGRFNQHS